MCVGGGGGKDVDVGFTVFGVFGVRGFRNLGFSGVGV